MIRVTENLRKIRDLLAETAENAGRSRDSVKLLAVSKKQPVSAVVEAVSAGQRDFGENQVQEGIDKITEIADPELVDRLALRRHDPLERGVAGLDHAGGHRPGRGGPRPR